MTAANKPHVTTTGKQAASAAAKRAKLMRELCADVPKTAWKPLTISRQMQDQIARAEAYMRLPSLLR